MPVKNLRDAFNKAADGALTCQQAYLRHGRPPEWGGKAEAQEIIFEGRYSTGREFQVSSGWIKCDADLDQAIAAIVKKMLETP